MVQNTLMVFHLVHHKSLSLCRGLQALYPTNPSHSSYVFALLPLLYLLPLAAATLTLCYSLETSRGFLPQSFCTYWSLCLCFPQQPRGPWQFPSTSKWQFLLFPHSPYLLLCFFFLHSCYHLPKYNLLIFIRCWSLYTKIQGMDFATLIFCSVLSTLQQCLALKGWILTFPVIDEVTALRKLKQCPQVT